MSVELLKGTDGIKSTDMVCSVVSVYLWKVVEVNVTDVCGSGALGLPDVSSLTSAVLC